MEYEVQLSKSESTSIMARAWESTIMKKFSYLELKDNEKTVYDKMINITLDECVSIPINGIFILPNIFKTILCFRLTTTLAIQLLQTYDSIERYQMIYDL